MADPTPAVSPGAQTSEFTLAKLGAFLGVGMVLGSIALSIFHPLPDVSAALLKYGLVLVTGVASVYAGFRTFLKYVAIAKGYEAQANAVAALLPGAVGTGVRKALPTIEEIVDAFSALGQAVPAPAPAAIAAQVALSTPVAPAASPAAPSAA